MDSMWLFLLTVVVGIAVVAMGYFVRKGAQAAGREMQWWHWLLSGLWVLIFILAFAWLGSFLGEGASTGKTGSTVQGAWLGWGILILINLFIGSLIWRFVMRHKISSG